MAFFDLFTLLTLIGLLCLNVIKSEGNLPDPCTAEDTECQNKAVENFLHIMSAGIPLFNIKPIDPMFVQDLNIPLGDEFNLTFVNIEIKGFKDEKISNFKLDKDANTMSYNAVNNLIISGDVTADYLQLGKSLSGNHISTADVLVNVIVNYKLETDDQGIQHMIIGPATIACKVSDVQYTLSAELEQARNEDPEIMKLREKYADKESELNELLICKFVETGYTKIEENFRTIAKAVPTTAFFSNL